MSREAPSSLLVVALVVLPLAFAAPTAEASLVNLVPNPSFEVKTSARALLPDQWTAMSLGLGVAARSQLQATDGAFSLAFVGAPRATTADVMFVRSDRVPYVGCSASFSYRADVVAGTLVGAVEYHRADGSWIRSDLLQVSTTPGWRLVSRAVEPPSGTVSVSFTFAASSLLGVTAHIDDVRFVPDGSIRFCEDWENGLNGWALESGSPNGYSFDCTRATSGSCSLRLAQPCCGEYVRVSRSLDLPLLPTQTFTFDFRGNQTKGDRDGLIQLRFDGAAVNVEWTYGSPESNNGLSLVNYDQPGRTTIVRWPASDRWYRAIVTIDGTDHAIGARLVDLTTGTPVGSTSEIGFSGTKFVGVSVQQVMWTSSTTTHHVDRIQLT